MPKQRTDRERLDEALEAQRLGTYVDPVQAAKALMSRRSVADDAGAFAASEGAARREAETLTPMGTAKRYGKPLADAGRAAAIPAAFLSGPVGMAAGSVLAMEGLGNALKDPTLGNAAMAGLGALSFAKPIMKGVKRLRDASTIRGIRQTEGAGDMGAAFSREKPYRAPSGASGRSNIDMTDLASEGGTTPINWRKPPSPPSAFDELMNTDYPQAGVVDDVPVAQEMPGASDIEDVLAGLGARLDEIPTGRGAMRPAVEPHGPPQRPAPDFVHPADTSGSAFGFDELPEIGESELTRLQALFKRLGL